VTDERTIAVYDAGAADYAKLSRAKPDADLRAFMALLPKGGRVLDYGCGPGGSSVLLQQAGFIVDAFDAAPSMVEIAQARGINARHATFDDLLPQKYDGIFANFSLLHAPRAALPQHLAAITKALNPSGIFHIAMKTGTGAGRDSIDRLYTYVTEHDLHAMLTQAGLAQIFSRTGLDKGFAGTDDAFVITLSRKA
jgi:trans-aconitate methyltransferase